jgi:hypothetical protein
MRFTYSIGQRCDTINVTPAISKECVATIQHAILFIVIGKNGSGQSSSYCYGLLVFGVIGVIGVIEASMALIEVTK